MELVINKVICGTCAKQKGLSKEKRISMYYSLPEGYCECTCGRFFLHHEGDIKEVDKAVKRRRDLLRY